MPRPDHAAASATVTQAVLGLFVLLFCLALTGCSLFQLGGSTGGSSVRGTKTYTVRGKTYRPYLTADGYREEGIASWYGKDFHGRKTANGEIYNMFAMTAAHKLLPLGTNVRVTHLQNGRSIMVRVNDRGPFVGSRIIDLSYAAARSLGMLGSGTARVRVEAVGGVRGARSGDLDGRFYVQLAALSKESAARALVRTLQIQKLGGRVIYAQDARLWRVQAGPFSSLSHAENIVDMLTARYPGCFALAE